MTFEELYRMRQGMAGPRINVNQIQARMPNWLNATFRDPGNMQAAQFAANQMNRAGDMDLREREMQSVREANRALASIQMKTFMAKNKENSRKAAAREQQQQRYEAFAQTLPPGLQAAARANPEVFTEQFARSQYRQPKTSTPQQIFQEMGGQAGTGKTFPEWYGTDYKRGQTTNVSVQTGGMKEPIRKRLLNSINLLDSVRQLRGLIEQHGPESFGDTSTLMGNLHTDIIMGLKDQYGLGVISGPDAEYLESQLSNPSEWPALFQPKSKFMTQLGEIERRVSRGNKTLMQTLSPGEREAFESGAGTGDRKWNRTQSGVEWSFD